MNLLFSRPQISSFLANSSNFPLHEECPNTELFLIRIFPYLGRIREKTDQNKTPYSDTFHAVFGWFFQHWAYPQVFTPEALPVLLHISKIKSFSPTVSSTAWKMSKYGVFLVRIFTHLDWIRWDTDYDRYGEIHFSRSVVFSR